MKLSARREAAACVVLWFSYHLVERDMLVTVSLLDSVSLSMFSILLMSADCGPGLEAVSPFRTAMNAAEKALFSGHAFTAAQTFVAGVSRQTKKRELTSDIGRKDFGFAHEEFDNESGFYEGTFKVNLRNGCGVLMEANSGASYTGQFLHERRHRHGVQKWPGSSYDGEWEHGEKHGKGIYTSSTSTYDGKWAEGFRHGPGKQLYNNGDEYSGTWFKGQCSGPGVYYHADGSEFHGAWASGKRHGAGMWFGPKNQKEHHFYKYGVLLDRKILEPGSKPPRGQRAIQPMHSDRVVATQRQTDMLKDTVFDSIPYLGHLSVKDSTIMDLSAPSIRRQQAAANVAEMKIGLWPFDSTAGPPASPAELLEDEAGPPDES